MRLFRLKAVVPLLLVLAAGGTAWYLFLDEGVRRSIEAVGTAIVGARVDLEEADVRLGEGSVTLRGLQVTNPDAPMTNLFQVDEIVADLRMGPLLEKKVYIDTAAVRGVRFGTARETSGAVENPSPESQELRRRLSAWADRVPVPDFSLAGLTGSVNVAALNPESLETRRLALAIRGGVDSARSTFQAGIQRLNPEPVIDSARALAERLEGASPLRLGIQGMASSLQSARSTLEDVNELRTGLTNLRQTVDAELLALDRRVGFLDAARARDLAAARNLLQIPSLDAPDISPALFGDLALSRIQSALYWMRTAERYVPPGLDPRRRPGPDRARLSGTSVEFPRVAGYAALTVAFAQLDVLFEGEGASAGRYNVVVNDLSSSPTVHGRPMRISASRAEAAQGPDAVDLLVVLDHVSENMHDSVQARLSGISLPTVTLPGLGAQLDLGRGVTDLSLVRTGDSIVGTWQWQTASATWDRGALGPGRINDIIWRSLNGLRNVDLEVRVGGSIDGPRIGVRSNIASEISRSLQRELRSEVQAAEAQLRAEVDRLVAEPVNDARQLVNGVQQDVRSALAEQERRIEEVRAELEARIAELRRFVPVGSR